MFFAFHPTLLIIFVCSGDKPEYMHMCPENLKFRIFLFELYIYTHQNFESSAIIYALFSIPIPILDVE